jgi:hypothetical protein
MPIVDAFPKRYGRKGASCCLYAVQCRAMRDLSIAQFHSSDLRSRVSPPLPASAFPFRCGTVSRILRLGAAQELSLAFALWKINDVVPLRWQRNLILV